MILESDVLADQTPYGDGVIDVDDRTARRRAGTR